MTAYLTLSTDKRDLIFSSFLDSASVTTLTSHNVTLSFLQHHKITRGFVTTQLDALCHAPYRRHLKQHPCVPAVAKLHVVEEHSLSAETFCNCWGVGWSGRYLLVWEEHVTSCYSRWWRQNGWRLDGWEGCWSSLQLL